VNPIHEDDLAADDWDDPTEEHDPDGRYEQYLADQADAEYIALPWWGKRLHDWRNNRAQRRARRRYQKAAKGGRLRADGFDTEPPF
jgi:hypothetical protein